MIGEENASTQKSRKTKQKVQREGSCPQYKSLMLGLEEFERKTVRNLGREVNEKKNQKVLNQPFELIELIKTIHEIKQFSLNYLQILNLSLQHSLEGRKKFKTKNAQNLLRLTFCPRQC